MKGFEPFILSKRWNKIERNGRFLARKICSHFTDLVLYDIYNSTGNIILIGYILDETFTIILFHFLLRMQGLNPKAFHENKVKDIVEYRRRCFCIILHETFTIT